MSRRRLSTAHKKTSHSPQSGPPEGFAPHDACLRAYSSTNGGVCQTLPLKLPSGPIGRLIDLCLDREDHHRTLLFQFRQIRRALETVAFREVDDG